ncbi:MAG: MBL fold metallo-hydrolase [Euryarchaeota archaeon]|jgi:L-ascorbate metabolism protein UlaG (beta-lactamase superfamily)|nr:MBL fold metallo-hydrolase [Euryarchaeota archaeon]
MSSKLDRVNNISSRNNSIISNLFKLENSTLGYTLIAFTITLWFYRNNLQSINILLAIIAIVWLAVKLLARTKLFTKREEDFAKPSAKRQLKLLSLIIVAFVTFIIVSTTLVVNIADDFGAEPTPHDSPNYEDGAFQNLKPTNVQSENASFWGTLGSYMVGDDLRSPNVELPSKQFELMNLNPGQISITWFGHSTILLHSNNVTLITDPVFGESGTGPLSLGPAPFPYENTYNLAELPDIDYVFISHDHYDHLDMDTAKYLRDSKFFVPLGVKAHLLSWGIDKENIQEFDWFDEANLSEDLHVALTPARHFSGRSIGDGDSTLWASWAFNLHDKAIFFSGDTGYMEEFVTIGERYGPFDIAFLESGQYNEAWSEIHMLPAEVVQAGLDLNTSAILPIHNSKFELALHRWDEPLELVSSEGAQRNLTVATPMIGESFILGDSTPHDAWWRNVSYGEPAFLKESPIIGFMLIPLNIVGVLWIFVPWYMGPQDDSEE